MNKMYYDRQFLPVHYIPEMPLIDRLIHANSKRKNSYKLSAFIDVRTLDEHFAKPVEASECASKKSAWAFYIPNDTCPLNYRELALWFVLWSVKPEHSKPYFSAAFSGLDKLAGLGKRQASEVADRLEDEGLIMVKRTEGWPWFYLHPFEQYASWFVPLTGREVPAEFIAAHEQATKETVPPVPPSPSIVSQPIALPVTKQEPKEWSPIIPTLDQIANGFELTSGREFAKEALIMLNEAIPVATRKTGTWNAERWWKLAEAKGEKPFYDPANAIVIQAAHAKMGNRLNN